MTDREQSLAHLRFMLGRLVDPVLRYCEGHVHSTERARELRAQLENDLPPFLEQVQVYGAGYSAETSAIRMAARDDLLRALVHFVYPDATGPQITKTFVEQAVDKINGLLADVPRRAFSGLLSEGSPFQFYLWLRAVCENADKHITLVDPYPSVALFTRYLLGVRPEVACTVVTRQRPGRVWEEFEAASALFSAERPSTYKLLLHATLHDRFVLADERSWQVGPSLKDGAEASPASIASGNHGPAIEALVAASKQHHPPPG